MEVAGVGMMVALCGALLLLLLLLLLLWLARLLGAAADVQLSLLVAEALEVRLWMPGCGVTVGLVVHVVRLELLVGLVVAVEGLAVMGGTEGRVLRLFLGCSWPVAMRRAGQLQTQQPSLPHLPSCGR